MGPHQAEREALPQTKPRQRLLKMLELMSGGRPACCTLTVHRSFAAGAQAGAGQPGCMYSEHMTFGVGAQARFLTGAASLLP